MATYVPNASELTEPAESREVVTSAAEHRAIKAKLEAVQTAVEGLDTAALQLVAGAYSAAEDIDMNGNDILDAGLVSAAELRLGGLLFTPADFDPDTDSAALLRGELAAAGGSALVGVSIYETVASRFSQVFNAASYGFSPTNTAIQNTTALQLLSAAVNAAGGGKVVFPSGTYAVGAQDLSGSFGQGVAWRRRDMFKIENCTKSVVVECYGTVFRMANGLRFGSFHPVTGAPYTPPGMPFLNQDYGADPGMVFQFSGNSGGVVIKGSVEIDGNNTNMIIGGTWGDNGYQRMAYGVWEYTNKFFYIENAWLHHHGTDGMISGHFGTLADSVPTPRTLINVNCEYNGRQGLSWVGGRGLTAINCNFNYTGRAVNVGTGVPLVSNPAAGLDIEAEAGVVRDGVFINCVMADNRNLGMVAESGDSADVRFIDCKFYGRTAQSIWPRKPRFVFDNCLIAGQAVQSLNAANQRDRTKFRGCTFSANESFNGVPQRFGSSLTDFTAQNPVFEDCTFITNQSDVSLSITSATATYRNCQFTQNGYLSNSLPVGMFEGVNNFTIATGAIDLVGSLNFGKINVTGSVLGLASVAGQVANTALPASSSIDSIGFNGAAFQRISIVSLNIAPTTGTWRLGDRCINNVPSVGAPKGWVCTAAGTPGTWVSEGNL